MPNECCFDMRIKGNKDDVKEFVKIIKADYDEVPKHFWRVFSASIIDETDYYTDLYGYCAWSVHSCMRDGIGTYNRDLDGNKKERGTTLQEQSAKLHLQIEVYSTEPGMAFAEHYLYKNGECVCEDCIDYCEYFFENEEELLAYQKEGKFTDITWKDVDCGWYTVGGYGDWEYAI